MKPNITKKQAAEISELVNKLMDIVEGYHDDDKTEAVH